MRVALLLGLTTTLLLTGCKSFLSGEVGEPEYAKDASGNLRLGDEALAGHDYPTAEKFFNYVKSKYPYSDDAKQAELRMADTSFLKEEFVEARDRYTNFVKLHPIHPKVDYAAFRAALCHYEEFKKSASDLFIFPPSYEKDQTQLLTAVQALTDFMHGYPNSQYVPQAQRILQDARKRLGEHEMYVAGFYAKRDYWRAAAGRWKTVVDDYPNLGLDVDAAFKLVDAYRTHLHQPQKAQAVLQTLIDRYPGTPQAQRAQKLLQK